MSNGDPIIIKGGGSIEVHLSKDTFPPAGQNTDKHYCADRHITHVYITDEGTGETTKCPIPDHGKFTISIEHSR